MTGQGKDGEPIATAWELGCPQLCRFLPSVRAPSPGATLLSKPFLDLQGE